MCSGIIDLIFIEYLSQLKSFNALINISQKWNYNYEYKGNIYYNYQNLKSLKIIIFFDCVVVLILLNDNTFIINRVY